MAKTRALYIGSLVFALLTALFFESAVGFVLLYALLILLVFAFASLLLAPLFVKVEQDGGGRYLVKGDELAFTIAIHNKSPLIFPTVRLRLADGGRLRYSPVEAFSLGGRERVEIGMTAAFPYRGVYTVGAQRVLLSDFMGLFRFAFTLPEPEAVVVYPKKAEDFSLSLNREMLSRESANYNLFSDSYEEFSDLRQYDPNDDYRKIHWKLSAKRSELIVKNFKAATLNKSQVILDTRPPPSKGEEAAFEDHMVSVAAAAIDYCLGNRLLADLSCGPDSLPVEVGGADGLGAAWEALARVRFDASRGIDRALERILTAEEGLYDIVLITSRMEQADYDAVRDACDLGHSVTLWLLHPRWKPPIGRERELLEALESLGAELVVEESA